MEGLKCPRDGTPLILLAESEKLSDGNVRATYYHKCPLCGFRRDLERLELAKNKEAIAIKRTIFR